MSKKVKEVLGSKGSPIKEALNVAGKNSKQLKSLKIKLKFKE
jgi:hypothetical protein